MVLFGELYFATILVVTFISDSLFAFTHVFLYRQLGYLVQSRIH